MVENVEIQSQPNIVIYSMFGCGACEEVKEYMIDHQIQFTEKSISRSEANGKEMVKKSGLTMVPQVYINGKLFIGSNKAIGELKRLGL